MSAESDLARVNLTNNAPAGQCLQLLSDAPPANPPPDPGNGAVAYFIDTGGSEIIEYFWDVPNQQWVQLDALPVTP